MNRIPSDEAQITFISNYQMPGYY
ncbi:hypothetical protein Zm00014a_027543 [Zea mays]|uniref:Uncharacterized protein n=1 Tax=Zea mays TaxID=4577 RepID=A0A317YAT5_MAIZE|nr:hypothetical protein Zm00014a_027543 [Zea mays]